MMACIVLLMVFGLLNTASIFILHLRLTAVRDDLAVLKAAFLTGRTEPTPVQVHVNDTWRAP